MKFDTLLYTRGLCGGRHFLTVASRDPYAAERGRAHVTHALLKIKQ